MAAGTFFSVCLNGLPPICFMRMNVMKMTSKMTGIVQMIRRMMNVAI